jgi:hypothetical protein
MSKKRWTEEEITFLKENFMDMSTKELADKLDMTESAVHNKMRRLKLKRNITWTKDMILKRIRELSTRGESLLSSEVQKNHNLLYSAACRHFGNWSTAVNEAGFDYDKIHRGR